MPERDPTTTLSGLNRRRALQVLGSLGIGTAVFRRALAVQAQGVVTIDAEMVRQAEWVAGLELTDAQRQATAHALTTAQRKFAAMRQVDIPHGVPPALTFYPSPPLSQPATPASRTARPTETAAGERPDTDEDLAFLPVSELSALLRTRQVSSVELTKIYLQRLRAYDPALRCVVSYTDERALALANRADREIARGRYRGPLHGIPWGAKDLISYPGYKTTWGAEPYRDQQLNGKATVAQRMDEAGAVLVAKLTLGALAWGDNWFGGKTRNPWNPREGSSGSSAGSSAATAAGLAGFTLGSETLGSIVSPCRRCGTSGLRPTFGRVSRHGCMTLAWSMDKIGPIARSVEDCALVFAALQGSDGLDPTVVDRPFQWPAADDIQALQVGYFDNGKPPEDRDELRVLKRLGVTLVPVTLPERFPVWAMTIILNTEAATVFDELTRNQVEEGLFRWPNAWRQGQFVPAVEYLRANRLRTMLIREMQGLMSRIDAYVGGDDLALTNLTGHPTVVLPGPLEQRNGAEVPGSITFTGQLFGESKLLALAHAWQQETGYHLRRPPMERLREPVE